MAAWGTVPLLDDLFFATATAREALTMDQMLLGILLGFGWLILITPPLRVRHGCTKGIWVAFFRSKLTAPGALLLEARPAPFLKRDG